MNQTIIGGKNSEYNRQLHEAREARLTKVHEAFLNSENGMSVKELAIDFGITSNLARDYVNTLLERNVIRFDHKDGKAPIYTIVKITAEETQAKPAAEEAKSEDKAPETLEVKPDGKEFAPGSYIPCSKVCKPGDVVWISSRSGEGQFFRYLIITPWERKAMVLGILLEGHPQLNLNDPYYVYIGNDPETQKAMYADIRNNCQRGYKQFGERLIHVDKDLFDDVKARLARSMGFEPCKDKSIIIERYKHALDKSQEQRASKDKEVEELKEKNESLKRDLKNSYIHQDEYKKAADDATELNRQLSDENDKLQKKYLQLNDSITQMYRECSRMSKELDTAKKENADLKQQISDISTKDATVIQPKYDDDTVMGMIIDSEVKKTKIEVYEEEIKMLRQMVFNMIKGGSNNG